MIKIRTGDLSPELLSSLILQQAGKILFIPILLLKYTQLHLIAFTLCNSLLLLAQLSFQREVRLCKVQRRTMDVCDAQED